MSTICWNALSAECSFPWGLQNTNNCVKNNEDQFLKIGYMLEWWASWWSSSDELEWRRAVCSSPSLGCPRFQSSKIDTRAWSRQSRWPKSSCTSESATKSRLSGYNRRRVNCCEWPRRSLLLAFKTRQYNNNLLPREWQKSTKADNLRSAGAAQVA